MSNEMYISNESCAPDRTTCRCAWPWISGFFAAPAFVHLVRALGGWRVVVGGWSVPLWVSWVSVAGCGLAAMLAGILGWRVTRKLNYKGRS